MKRKISTILSMLLFITISTNLFAQNIQKVEVTMPFTKGLNLTSWLEPFGLSNANSSKFGKSDFQDIKSLGVEIVRIPIHFEEWSSGEPDYIIPEWLWKKIDNAISWCTELEMYMIIDFHNNCDGNSKTRSDIEKVLLKIWPQIAQRYKDSSKYVLYEVMNEPHMKSQNIQNDYKKWAKIQGNVLKAIRAIDSKHTVIVGGEGWNSIEGLQYLPDYKDDNLIFNFHDYSPFLFTHQGASWTDLKQIKNIPFPYVAEKMPPLPKNPTSSEYWNSKNYPQDSKEEVLVEPLNKAVEIANKRKVALMCNEYGVYMPYADNEERTNWYRMKAKWFEERGIIRVSWDYKGGFGIFNKEDGNFPEDLNIPLIKGMGFKVPPMEKRNRPNWLEAATQKNDFTIYKNGFSENLQPNGWINPIKGKVNLTQTDSSGKDSYIYIPSAKAYNSIQCYFKGKCDFTPLVQQGKKLEFEIRTKEKDLRLNVYFRNQFNSEQGKAGLEWRSAIYVRNNYVPADGNWHKISVPLNNFSEQGAWDNADEKWYNPENLFTWEEVDCICFDFADIDLKNETCIRNIEIK